MDKRPIGIFDSGLGGLTVLREIMKCLPNENIIYFGDCGRVPYGTKSKETVVKYTLQDIKLLLKYNVKMIVIACNTASAYSYDTVKDRFGIPVIEVIRPGAAAAAKKTRNKKVGVIGTKGTISSGVYEKAIKEVDSSIQIFSKACPLFVQLVEEGWWDNDITARIADEYLTPLKQKEIDTLVLGCTHYPLLKKIISEVMGDGITLVGSGEEVARAVKGMADSHNEGEQTDKSLNGSLQNVTVINNPIYRYYTSDSIEQFKTLGSAFLEREINSVEKVDIEKY